MRPKFAALLLAVYCSWAAVGVRALRDDDQLLIGGRAAGSYLSWGALAGANLTTALSVLTQTPSPAVIPPSGLFAWALLLNDDQFSNVASTDLDYLCRSGYLDDPSNAFFGQRMGFSNGTAAATAPVTAASFSGIAPASAFYYYVFISCTNLDLTLQVSLHFTQADGNELSSGQIPFPKLTQGYALAWGVAGCLIVLNLALARCLWKRPDPGATAMLTSSIASMTAPVDPALSLSRPLSPVRPLHWALLAVPVLAIANSLASKSYYDTGASTGSFSTALAITMVALATVETAALIAVILLVARGWQVTRLTLDANETRHVGFICVVFVAAYATFQVLTSLFFLFLLMVVFVLMLRYVFASVSWKLRLLGAFRAYSRGWLSAITGGRIGGSGNDGDDDPAARASANSLLSVEEDHPAFYNGSRTANAAGVNAGTASSSSSSAGGAMRPSAIASNTIYVAQISAGNDDDDQDSGNRSGASRSPYYTMAEMPSSSSSSSAQQARSTTNNNSSSASVPSPSPYDAIPIGNSSSNTGAEGQETVPLTLASPSSGSSSSSLSQLQVAVPIASGSATASSPAAAGAGAADSVAVQDWASTAPQSSSNNTRWSRFTERARRLLGDASAVREGTLTARQMQALRYFRFAIVLYLMSSMMLQIWAVLSSLRTPWMGFVLTETVNVLMLLYLAWLFRARPDSSHSGCLYDPYGYSAETSLLGAAAGAGMGVGGYGSSAAAPAGATESSASSSATVASAPARPTLLVVQNPDGSTSASSSDAYGSSGGGSRIVLAEISEPSKV